MTWTAFVYRFMDVVMMTAAASLAALLLGLAVLVWGALFQELWP
ncbi:MAG: hypothetical protein O7A04_03840 [Acidobacteria bacterium]|nr:hypothetical protein [Acidobacteriota bacterium]